MTTPKSVTIDETKLSEVTELRQAVMEASAECDSLLQKKAAKLRESRDIQTKLDEQRKKMEESEAALESVMKELHPALRKVIETNGSPTVAKNGTKTRVTHEEKVAWAVSLLKKQKDNKCGLTELNHAYKDEFQLSPGPLKKELAKDKQFKFKGKGFNQTVELATS